MNNTILKTAMNSAYFRIIYMDMLFRYLENLDETPDDNIKDRESLVNHIIRTIRLAMQIEYMKWEDIYKTIIIMEEGDEDKIASKLTDVMSAVDDEIRKALSIE